MGCAGEGYSLVSVDSRECRQVFLSLKLMKPQEKLQIAPLLEVSAHTTIVIEFMTRQRALEGKCRAAASVNGIPNLSYTSIIQLSSDHALRLTESTIISEPIPYQLVYTLGSAI
jgi:hypothetical protein